MVLTAHLASDGLHVQKRFATRARVRSHGFFKPFLIAPHKPEQTQRASRKTNSLSWYERVFVCIALFGIKRVSGEMEGPCQAAMGSLLYLFALIGALHLLQQGVTGLRYGGALKRRRLEVGKLHHQNLVKELCNTVSIVI